MFRQREWTCSRRAHTCIQEEGMNVFRQREWTCSRRAHACTQEEGMNWFRQREWTCSKGAHACIPDEGDECVHSGNERDQEKLMHVFKMRE